MTTYEVGEVVLVAFPQSGTTGTTLTPWQTVLR